MNRREFMMAAAATAAMGGVRAEEAGKPAEEAPIIRHDAPPRNRHPYKDVDWSTALQIKGTTHVHCKTQEDLDVILNADWDSSRSPTTIRARRGGRSRR